MVVRLGFVVFVVVNRVFIKDFYVESANPSETHTPPLVVSVSSVISAAFGWEVLSIYLL